jgi:non-heme chloroperoxidase
VRPSPLIHAWCAFVLAMTVFAADAWKDPSPHLIRFVTVEKNVRLEVLDWGGSGLPVVFLAGLGNTAHVFDDLAPKLGAGYHAYGITRRGYGKASLAASEFTSDRLTQDVLGVLNSVKLDRAVLVGHSFAGEELSALGSQYPSRIAGLVYLDAAYDRTVPGLMGISVITGRPAAPGPKDLASFSALRAYWKRLGIPLPEADLRERFEANRDGSVGKPLITPGVGAAIMASIKKPDYEHVRVPALAIYAIPHELGPWVNMDDSAVRATVADFETAAEAQAREFQNSVARAQVVRLPRANHYVFLSNEADVLRELRAFLLQLDGKGDATERGAARH